MLVYQDLPMPPDSEDICIVSQKDNPDFNSTEFINYIEGIGDIIVKIECVDDVVFVVRLMQ